MPASELAEIGNTTPASHGGVAWGVALRSGTLWRITAIGACYVYALAFFQGWLQIGASFDEAAIRTTPPVNVSTVSRELTQWPPELAARVKRSEQRALLRFGYRLRDAARAAGGRRPQSSADRQIVARRSAHQLNALPGKLVNPLALQPVLTKAVRLD